MQAHLSNPIIKSVTKHSQIKKFTLNYNPKYSFVKTPSQVRAKNQFIGYPVLHIYIIHMIQKNIEYFEAAYQCLDSVVLRLANGIIVLTRTNCP